MASKKENTEVKNPEMIYIHRDLAVAIYNTLGMLPASQVCDLYNAYKAALQENLNS